MLSSNFPWPFAETCSRGKMLAAPNGGSPEPQLPLWIAQPRFSKPGSTETPTVRRTCVRFGFPGETVSSTFPLPFCRELGAILPLKDWVGVKVPVHRRAPAIIAAVRSVSDCEPELVVGALAHADTVNTAKTVATKLRTGIVTFGLGKRRPQHFAVRVDSYNYALPRKLSNRDSRSLSGWAS
jgi:hypothetical protein